MQGCFSKKSFSIPAFGKPGKIMLTSQQVCVIMLKGLCSQGKKRKERGEAMTSERFYSFVQLIDSVHKLIQKIRIDTAPDLGVKSVHIFWVYELYAHPEGLTAAELAAKSMISRSLISREIEALHQDGYVDIREMSTGKRKNYNALITLTEKGNNLATQIVCEGLSVQNRVNEGITEEELASFYATLNKLCNNLKIVARERQAEDGDDADSQAISKSTK